MLFWDIFLQISLMEECSFLERALEELHKKEFKIVSIFDIDGLSRLSRHERTYSNVKLLSILVLVG